MKINSLFIYIGNIYFGIYLNKNILVNVRYKRQVTLPFYIPQFKLSRKGIPLFYTPQIKRSRVQVLFLVYRSGCCFYSTRVACTLELGLREMGYFSLSRRKLVSRYPSLFVSPLFTEQETFNLIISPKIMG